MHSAIKTERQLILNALLSTDVSIIYAQAWFEMKNKWKFKPNSRTEELSWCKRNLISLIGINQVAELVKELTARLARFNIRPLRKLIHRYVGQRMKPFLSSLPVIDFC